MQIVLYCLLNISRKKTIMLYTTGLFTKGAVTVVPRQREGRVWARSKVVKMGWSEFILLELKENQRQ